MEYILFYRQGGGNGANGTGRSVLPTGDCYGRVGEPEPGGREIVTYLLSNF